MKPWYSDVLAKDDPELRAEVARALLQERGLHKGQVDDHAGRVIEFRRGKNHVCGVLQPRPGQRGWRVLDQDGRTRSVRGDKIIDIGSERVKLWQRHEIVRILQAIDRRREAVKAELDLRMLWEVAREHGERAWSLDELAELYFGEEIDSDGRAALARALDEGRWFAREGKAFVAKAAEVVAQGDLQESKRQEAKERLQAWATWLRGVADGEVVARPERAGEAIALLEQVALHGEDGEGSSQAVKLMQGAHLHGPLAAFELLVKLGQWSADENLELRKHRLPVEFAPETLAAAEELGWQARARKARRWRGGKVYGFANYGQECDRALSVRRTLFGYRVGVHFASPALLEEGPGLVEAAARERAASLHLPERLIPMLPRTVASQCKLTTGEWRPALSVVLRFDRGWRLKKRSLEVRRVKVGQILEWDSAAGPVEDRQWERLHGLALKRRKLRAAAGALLLPGTDIEPRVRDGQVEIQTVDRETPGRLVCEELTVLANAVIGEICGEQGIPAVYRTQPEGRILEGEVDERVRVHEQVKLLSGASLQTVPDRHHGLGVEAYVPASRPLHRYADWLMHRQLVAHVQTGQPLFSEEEVERALVETAWAREVTGKIEAAGRRYWLLKYLEGRLEDEIDAVVVERRGRGYLVELEECRLKRFVHGGRELWAVPGDRMRVRIVQISARRELVRLEEVT